MWCFKICANFVFYVVFRVFDFAIIYPVGALIGEWLEDSYNFHHFRNITYWTRNVKIHGHRNLALLGNIFVKLLLLRVYTSWSFSLVSLFHCLIFLDCFAMATFWLLLVTWWEFFLLYLFSCLLFVRTRWNVNFLLLFMSSNSLAVVRSVFLRLTPRNWICKFHMFVEVCNYCDLWDTEMYKPR